MGSKTAKPRTGRDRIDIIEAEGYLTSGVTALSILADVFAGDESVYAYLETLIARHDWQGFKYDVVPALLRGFDGARARQIVERGILDHSLGTYERSGMLNAYFRTKRSDPRVVAFAKQMLKANDEPEMRAAVFRAMTYFADALDSDELGRLREIVASDGDENLRIAALQLIGERQDQVDFVLERATAPDTNNIRSVAIGLAHDLGYRDSNWYAQIFAHDAADSIRSIALTHLISSVGEDELRTLLVREMERTDLGVAAARSAFEALNRWPNEPTIRKLVENMLERLPKEVGAWRNLLRTRLSRS